MLSRPLVALAALLALAGCSSTPAPLSLKESCDALGAVLTEFGQVEPTAQRYGDYAGKVRAIQERGDATTRDALQPLVAALDKGAQGDVTGAIGAQMAATMPLMVQCATAGSSGLTPASSPPSASPTPTSSATPLPADDFVAELAELERTCTGDTCSVEARVAVGYVGVDDLDKALVTVTVVGGAQPETRSLVVAGDDVNTFELTAQVPKGTKLSVSIDRVESY